MSTDVFRADPAGIADFRAALGISQPALADLLAVSQVNVSRWESGQRLAPYGIAGDLEAIYARFLEDIQALRAGAPIDPENPWFRAARFWAGHRELDPIDWQPSPARRG